MMSKAKHEVKEFFKLNQWQWAITLFVLCPTWVIGVHALFHDPKYAVIFFTMSLLLVVDIKSKGV